MVTLLPIRYNFRSLFFLNRQVWPRLASHTRQSFHFQKITGTLKMNILMKIAKHIPFTVLQRTIVKNNFFFTFCLGPPKWATLFLTRTNEIKIEFLFIFSF